MATLTHVLTEVTHFAYRHGEARVNLLDVPGALHVPPYPEDLCTTLKRLHHQGGVVEIIYNAQTKTVIDAIVRG